MTEQPRTRQELYDRIRQTSKDEFILEEMIRLGFWPRQGTLPEDPAEEIRRQGALQRELETLRSESRNLNNEEHLRKAARKLRLQESRQKQQQNKERREQERIARVQVWEQRKQNEILYLGEGVSGGLNATQCDLERLASYGLPALVSVGQLRFLAFSRRTSKVSHYIRFTIPKKSGGERLISAPMPRLKHVQYWILANVLTKIPLHESAHGFRTGHSIVTNARPHVGADVVVNLDLKNFFPTITYKRVKGLFRALGYSEAAATIFGLLCTEPEIAALRLDQATYYVSQGTRHLPQGAPTSPAMTNLLCRRFDRRLTAMATALGFQYTRYADDLTFSGSGENLRHICTLLRRIESIVTHEGFVINEAKTRILRGGSQQEVTGIVVNDKLSVCRKTLRRFRALLFQIERDGPSGKHWEGNPNLFAAMQGFANFVYMVDPERGLPLRQKVRDLCTLHG
jgi:RNA-directed DNA polymerase